MNIAELNRLRVIGFICKVFRSYSISNRSHSLKTCTKWAFIHPKRGLIVFLPILFKKLRFLLVKRNETLTLPERWKVEKDSWFFKNFFTLSPSWKTSSFMTARIIASTEPPCLVDEIFTLIELSIQNEQNRSLKKMRIKVPILIISHLNCDFRPLSNLY